MTGQPDPRLSEAVYTVAEIAAYLRVSRPTVCRLIVEKKLKALQVRRGYRVTEAAWQDYLASSSERADAPVVATVP